MSQRIPVVFHLAFAVGGIYSSFLVWAFVQERVTAIDYISAEDENVKGRFTYTSVLNLCQALFATIGASVVIKLSRSAINCSASNSELFQVAFVNTLASPCGYASLQFIQYPMLVLLKSCKLIPVMLMGVLLGTKRYSVVEYLSVILVTMGVCMFAFKPGTLTVPGELSNLGCGVVLAGLNLVMDGYTNASQDKLNQMHKLSAMQMMFWMNAWAVVVLAAWLSVTWMWWGEESELGRALLFTTTFPDVGPHLLAFSLCGTMGQLFIFHTIREFGALVCTTVCITRKLFTIFISIIAFNKAVTGLQWCGIVTVFCGLGLNIAIKTVLRRSAKGGGGGGGGEGGGIQTTDGSRKKMKQG